MENNAKKGGQFQGHPNLRSRRTVTKSTAAWTGADAGKGARPWPRGEEDAAEEWVGRLSVVAVQLRFLYQIAHKYQCWNDLF